MKVNQAEIIISAVSETQYPNDGLPEIALAGRSNVGKSSFINKMINRKNLARTSSEPGKTRTLNFYKINEAFHFVDVPGYGYAKVSKTEREKWSNMMETYFESRDALKGVFQIVDVRHDPTQNDQLMYQYLKHFELPVVIIATKLDKISKNKQAKHIKAMKTSLQLAPEDDLVAFSADAGDGKDIAWRHVEQLIGIKK